MAQDTELEELYGKISSVIYTNEENGWTVLRMETDDGTDATVVGTGGLARTVAQATDVFDAIDPDLTLRGIREIRLWEQSR